MSKRLDLTDGALKLVVGFSRKAFGPPREFQELSARAVGAALRVGARTEVERHDVVGVVLIEHRAPSDLVHFLVRRLIDGGAAAQCRRSRSRTGRDAAQQRQGRPVANAATTLAIVAFGHVVACKCQDVVEQSAVLLAERVGGFFVLALGKGVSVSR